MTSEEKHIAAMKRVQELLQRDGPFTDEEISELRGYSKAFLSVGQPMRESATFRAAIEQIWAIRRFDDASAALIQTTNTLTTRILWLTIAAVFFGLIQIAVGLVQLLIALKWIG